MIRDRVRGSGRRWVAVGVVLASLGITATQVADAQVSGPTTCPDPGPDREAASFSQPPPSRGVRRLIRDFQAADPGADFTYFNCHVDSFATTPKATVPSYARSALAAAGISRRSQFPQFLPGMTSDPKLGQDLDADLNRAVPLRDEEFPGDDPTPGTAPDDERGTDPGTGVPLEEDRFKRALVLEPRDNSYRTPSAEDLRRGEVAAKPVLQSFLTHNAGVFEMGSADLAANVPSLTQVDFTEGRFFRKATFAQTLNGLPVLDGKTLVLYDANWNVINISRTILTANKLSLASANTLSQSDAEDIARRAVIDYTGHDDPDWQVALATNGVDVVRRLPVWDVQMVIPAEFDLTVRIHAGTGEVLNVNDNVLGATYNASVRRWKYIDGRLDFPAQVNSNVPTRDSNTLTHGTFYIVNDDRGGDPDKEVGPLPCNQTPEFTFSRSFAYGSTDGLSSVRPTVRTNRDFNIWSPSSESGTFAETHTYFWAREYMRWNTQALRELGVLADEPDDRPVLNIIVNGCDADFRATSFDMTKTDNNAETGAKIRLREDCRVTNIFCFGLDLTGSSSFVTCEDGGCAPSPSVIHHELNHFILGSYFGIGSGLDCSKGMQGMFIHEGTLGSVIPHMFWNSWYGVGYKPTFDEQLFTSSATRGRVHSDAASRLSNFDFSCPNFDNPDDDGSLGQQPYDAGRVAGQPLWEFVHGKKVDGDTINNTARFISDTDALIFYYGAADLADASTYRDRNELAVRLMELIDKLAKGVTPAIKADWCSIWDHHGLKQRIPASYCS